MPYDISERGFEVVVDGSFGRYERKSEYEELQPKCSSSNRRSIHHSRFVYEIMYHISGLRSHEKHRREHRAKRD